MTEPRSGFLGIGARKALVKVNLMKASINYGIDYLAELINYLTDQFVNRDSEHQMKLILDAENYRSIRKKSLIALAKRIAKETVCSGRPHRFEPMPAFERKIVHMVLSINSKIRTFSNGEEPRRYLMVAPRS